jgi:hypothetical protein
MVLVAGSTLMTLVFDSAFETLEQVHGDRTRTIRAIGRYANEAVGSSSERRGGFEQISNGRRVIDKEGAGKACQHGPSWNNETQ